MHERMPRTQTAEQCLVVALVAAFGCLFPYVGCDVAERLAVAHDVFTLLGRHTEDGRELPNQCCGLDEIDERIQHRAQDVPFMTKAENELELFVKRSRASATGCRASPAQDWKSYEKPINPGSVRLALCVGGMLRQVPIVSKLSLFAQNITSISFQSPGAA